MKYSRSSPDPENSQSGNQQPYNLSLVFANSGHFQKTLENQNWSIPWRKISCNLGEKMTISKKTFLKPIEKKSLFHFNYW